MKFFTIKEEHRLKKEFWVMLLDTDDEHTTVYGKYNEIKVAKRVGKKEAEQAEVKFIDLQCCCICGRPCQGPAYWFMLWEKVWRELELHDEALAHPWCIHDEIRPLTMDDFSGAPANDMIRFGYSLRMQEEGEPLPKSIVNMRNVWMEIERLQKRLKEVEG